VPWEPFNAQENLALPLLKGIWKESFPRVLDKKKRNVPVNQRKATKARTF